MELHTKAIYNLLRLDANGTSPSEVESWAVEDLRSVPLEALFQKLSELGISLDRGSFTSFAAECDTPEDLADLLLEDSADPKLHDRVYLLLFEVWRKLFPEKQSLSIFCDELDHLIFLYDEGALESDEPIQDILANLQEVLEENLDEGKSPPAIFQAICEYCAHDLEEFLYDYIAELLDNGDLGYASELWEGFSPFLPKSVWFEFLHARIVSFTDPLKANAEVARILNHKREFETMFLFEVLHFLSVSGEHPLFIAVIQTLIAQLEMEEEFQELMAIAASYYRRLDQDEVEKSIERLMEKRSKGSHPFNPQDPDVQAFARALR